jgi:hypothetical protein
MVVLRTDIERALDEIASQEEGMRFQGLAVVLGKKRWPELIARQRKKDGGLDAYAPSTLTPEKVGKGLAASITPTLTKISGDATTAKENFLDLKMLLFVTSAKVGNADRKKWEKAILKDQNLELHLIEREEIITQMMMPENASLLASFLHLDIEAEPQVVDLIKRTKRAAEAVTRTWADKTKGLPLIDLATVQIGPNGAESSDALSLEQIGQELSQSRRIVLEGSAGRGKTTMLIQLAERARPTGTAFIVELPAWTSSRRGILEYIAGMPAFQAEGLTAADLARVQQTEPFLLMLNGWNEITESNSIQANDALRELERDFPSAGIIVATRMHHLTPPLPGALRLRVLRLGHEQRAAYLTARLGARSAELLARIEADPSLDELTRTPFILSEVGSLFEAGADIPSTKMGVLAQVLRLQEQRDEHRNPLQATPIFGRQTDYLKSLATKMTRSGAVALPDADARAVAAAVTRELATLGQLDPVGAPMVLATLTSHHVLERVDYPQTAFQFEHQQLQEYYAALDVRARLLELRDDDKDATGRFTAEYVNDPAWAEPLRMIAETFAEKTGDDGLDEKNSLAGRKLVQMALGVDLVFAGELVRLCGPTVWNEMRAIVGERFRAVYAVHDRNYRQYAISAMLATGAGDFSDIIVPLLSGDEQQVRLSTYRLWPDIQVSLLGPNWRHQVRSWSEEARVDFVSELLHHRLDADVAAFAAEDDSSTVKKEAAAGLIWTGYDDALTRVLDSMDENTFEGFARQHADLMPAALRPKTVAAMRKFIDSAADYPVRLRTALDLIELGETGLDGVVKDAMAALPHDSMRNLGSHYIQPALEYLRKSDPVWASEWVAIRIAEGVLYGYEHWMPFVTSTPDGLVEKYLQRLETEDFKNVRFDGMVSVIAARADVKLAVRVFAKLCELRRKVDADKAQRHEFEWHVMKQLEAVFRRIPDDVAVAGILSAATRGDPLEVTVAANLLSRVARSDMASLRIADEELRANLREFLKNSVNVVLQQDDFNGEEKAHLASAISQVGKPEDMVDMVMLIRADIERVRRGRAARAAGESGPVANGGSMSYAGWHLTAVMHLDSAGAEQVLIDLLPEPEYSSEVASAMAREFLKQESSFDRALRYDLMWAARADRHSPPSGDQRRKRFGAALNAEIKRLREKNQDGKPVAGLKELAKALAAIDGGGSAATVLDVVAKPGQWDQYLSLEAIERLLVAGVVLPASTVFALMDSFLERTEKWMQDSDKYLLRRMLALCPFVDDPAAGVAKIRDVLGKRRLAGYELREIVTALGESRVDAAVDLLQELASDANVFENCEENFINSIAALDTPRARALLLGFVDPDIGGIALTRRLSREDMLVARVVELVKRRPEVVTRLRELCERDLPDLNRHFLSQVMDRLGTPEARTANLNLLDDARQVPRGIWDELQNAFVERRSYGQDTYVFTERARASNELRIRLFRMVREDQKRRKSAFMLLGQIEAWRLEQGRPTDEPRHPDLASGQSWPPNEP